MSRASKPKQFLSFGTPHTLFQETVLRCRSEIFDARPIVVGSEQHRFLIAEDLHAINVEADILLEPVPRNSTAAIAAGCLQALKRDKNSQVLILAADHHIPDVKSFRDAVGRAQKDAENGHLITFGIKPDRPATSYGYIEADSKLSAARKVHKFIEKPDSEKAKRYIEEGYLWNSGNFLFRADVFMQELGRLAPDIRDAVTKSFELGQSDLDFVRLDKASFEQAPSISVDYCIMEKTNHAAVLPVDYAWSDVGSWDAVAGVVTSDGLGNAVIGEASILKGRGNFIHSQEKLTTTVGINDVIVVATRDAVLVADKHHAEDVKTLVAQLQTEGKSEANTALQIFRPWGNYEQLDVGSHYQVKRITVKPGGELSLQKHKRRAEHWIVVAGEAEVTIGENVTTLQPNQSAHIPLGEVHRLANRGDEPVILIEVQSGDYFGEDDIIRLDDVYKRSEKPGSVLE